MRRSIILTIAVIAVAWIINTVSLPRNPNSLERRYNDLSKNDAVPLEQPKVILGKNHDTGRSSPRNGVGRIDPLLANLLNATLSTNDRISSDISARIPYVKNQDDMAMLSAVLRDASDNDTVRNEVANLLHRSHYDRFAEDLMAVLDNPAEQFRFRTFAMQHLGQVVPSEIYDPEGRERIVKRMTAALDDRDIPVRRQALQNLCRLKEPKGLETAIAWFSAKGQDADSVRDIAIRCLADLGKKEFLPAIRKYAKDPNEVIRIAALVTLAEWRDEGSGDALIDAVYSPSVRLQRCAEAALLKLPAVALTERMAGAIELLESKDFTAFFNQYVTRAGTEARTTPDESVAKLELKLLLRIKQQGIKPTFEPDGKIANFAVGKEQVVRFKRIDKTWFLAQ